MNPDAYPNPYPEDLQDAFPYPGHMQPPTSIDAPYPEGPYRGTYTPRTEPRRDGYMGREANIEVPEESNKKYIYRYNEEYGPHAGGIKIVDVDESGDDDFRQEEEDMKSLLNVS